jgi:hypothetical protein
VLPPDFPSLGKSAVIFSRPWKTGGVFFPSRLLKTEVEARSWETALVLTRI